MEAVQFAQADFGQVTVMDTNLAFYEKIKLSKFKEIARLQGFDTCPDLRILYPYLKNALEILEIGAGYGRVTQGLTQQGFQGHITALDRSPKMCAYTRQNASQSVSVIETDIRFYPIQQHPSAILWLWSGVLELSPDEQKEVIKKFAQALKSGGLLVLEIPQQIRYVGVHVGNQKIKVETEWGELNAYLPSHEEMLAFQKVGQFSSMKVINYKSDTGLERALYLYQK